MATYDILKTAYVKEGTLNSDNHLIYLGLGGVSGIFAVTLTYPSDVVRRRMQLSGTPGHR